MTEIFHGGDLSGFRRSHPDFEGPWADLSTGINPHSYPVGDIPQEIWARLPGSDLNASLLGAAASCYGAPDMDCVAAGPGSQALIHLLPRLRSTCRVAVLGPTYGEHEECWRAAGHHVRRVAQPDELQVDCNVAIVVNPNNPDGRLLDRPYLLALAERLATQGGWLILDEAFADLTTDNSLAGDVMRPGLIVLRSFGKFFGLAGLRLGFTLANAEITTNIRRHLGPWPVSGPAAWVGTRALADREWIEGMRARLAQEAADLDGILAGAGLEIAGGTALYRLVRLDRADGLFDWLGDHGIYVRHFPERPSFLRFGLPAGAEEADRLRAVLAAWREAAP